MSLYNMLFGFNRAAPLLLKALNLEADDIARFRDAFLRDGHIVIHTRTGGGNRDDYELENDELAAHPLYVRDEDDDFDCTYANFYFRFPEELADDLKALEAKTENHTPSEKWQALFRSMEDHQ